MIIEGKSVEKVVENLITYTRNLLQPGTLVKVTKQEILSRPKISYRDYYSRDIVRDIEDNEVLLVVKLIVYCDIGFLTKEGMYLFVCFDEISHVYTQELCLYKTKCCSDNASKTGNTFSVLAPFEAIER